MHAGILISGLLVASLMVAASGPARRLLDNVLDGTISWRQAASEGLTSNGLSLKFIRCLKYLTG